MERKIVRAPIAIRYRSADRPDHAGLVLIADQSDAAAARAELERRGFVILDDKAPAPGEARSSDDTPPRTGFLS